MKFFNKICIVLILLIFTMSFVSSTNVPDFKCPNTFEKTEDGSYINDMGQGIVVYEYDDSSISFFYQTMVNMLLNTMKIIIMFL